MNPSEHKAKTVSGLKWNAINQFLSQVITFGVGILLMRLLTPNDFGLIAMVTVFSGFVAIFKDFGLTQSLIQKKVIDVTDKSTIFFSNIILGLLLTLLLFLSANFIALFYDATELNGITKAIAIVFTINALGMVHLAILRRQLEFKKLFFINFFTVIFGGICAIYLALSDYGVWTLVYQQIITSLSRTLLAWVINKWRPSFIFSFQVLRGHLKFGLPLFANNSFNYWSRNADNLLIGKFLNSQALGLYSRAYNLMMLPITQVSRVVSGVMMPSLSIIQSDKERVKLIYLKMTRIIGFITFPLMGILFITAFPAVSLLFGEKWIERTPLLKFFAVIGAMQSLGSLSGTIYLSQGKTMLQFKVNLFVSFVNIIAFIIGVQISVLAVAQAYLIANLINVVPSYYFMGKIIDLSLKEILDNIKSHIFISILMVVIGLLTLNLLISLPNYAQVLLLVVEYLIGWLVLMKFFNSALVNELAVTFKEVIK